MPRAAIHRRWFHGTQTPFLLESATHPSRNAITAPIPGHLQPCLQSYYVGDTEDEMGGWHHRLDGHEFEQAPGVGDGQGSLACYSPQGRQESDMTERLNWLTEEEQFI